MSEKETKVTKQETLAALRNPGELYVIMSAATKMPFVKCDEETFSIRWKMQETRRVSFLMKNM